MMYCITCIKKTKPILGTFSNSLYRELLEDERLYLRLREGGGECLRLGGNGERRRGGKGDLLLRYRGGDLPPPGHLGGGKRRGGDLLGLILGSKTGAHVISCPSI